MRDICRYDLELLCVNNYRGSDYGKPDICVDCEDCKFNPKNEGMPVSLNDSDKVVIDELKEIVIEKIEKIKNEKS